MPGKDFNLAIVSGGTPLNLVPLGVITIPRMHCTSSIVSWILAVVLGLYTFAHVHAQTAQPPSNYTELLLVGPGSRDQANRDVAQCYREAQTVSILSAADRALLRGVPTDRFIVDGVPQIGARDGFPVARGVASSNKSTLVSDAYAVCLLKRGYKWDERIDTEALPAYARLSRADLAQIMDVVGMKRRCDSLSPSFARATASGYRAWRGVHQRVVDEIEAQFFGNTPENTKPSVNATQERETARTCKRLERFLTTPHPDPRFSTPLKTWETYTLALKNGQRQTALDCLADIAYNDLAELFEQESPEFLAQIGSGFEAPKPHQKYDDEWLEFSTVRNGQFGLISFRRIEGEWKITKQP